MNEPTKLPFYIKASVLIVGLYFFVSILSIARDILLPLIYATIIAIAISPVVNALIRRKISRILSIFIVLFVAVLVSTVLVRLIALQASNFSEALPQLTTNFQTLLNQIIAWASGYFNISTQKINAWIANSKQELINYGSQSIGSTLSAMGFVLEAALLTIVYICMILYYQSHLREFVHKLFSAHHDEKVSHVLANTKTIIQGYLVGLFVEFGLVAVLNSIGLLLLGIDYAVLLGIIGALLNVIPIIGGIVGIALYMGIALATKSPVYVLYVIALHTFIQFVDNHYIIPKIVGSKVKLNAHVCLLAVILGGALWGIPGMFLSIPLTAIIMLICNNIDSLKPWGFLMSDDKPVSETMKFNFTIKGFQGRLLQKNQTKNDKTF